MSSRRNIIFETPFPIYCLRAIGDRHFLVAGGGGQAKTGVPNHVEIFLFDVHENSWELLKTTVMDTGIMATMNLDVFPIEPARGHFLIACGQEGNCRVYQLKYDVALLMDGQILPTEASMGGAGSARRRRRTSDRRSSTSPPRLQNGVTKKLGFYCEEVKIFQSDFSCSPTIPNTKQVVGLGSFQKVVRFASNGQCLITGGADGHFRVWEWPSCRKMLDHNAHKDDVDDLDVSPDCGRLVTVGRDGCGFVWQLKDAAKLADLTHLDTIFEKQPATSAPAAAAAPNVQKPTKYRYRFCRFVPTLSNKRAHTFFTCAIPVVRSAKKQACYLARWQLSVTDNTCRRSLCRTAPTDGEIISAISFSDDGRFMGLGTLGGSVVVVDTEELNLIKIWKEAHEIFVTAVDFLPIHPQPTSAFSPLMAGAQCALVSASAANCCQLHTVPLTKRNRNIFWLILVAFMKLLILFYFLNFFEL